MHDPRTSSALRTLADLTRVTEPQWSWSIRRLDAAGRLCLPGVIVSALGPGRWRVRWHHLALVVGPDTGDDGPRAVIDVRGPLTVPVWLRERGQDVLVGLDRSGLSLVVAPVELLDRLGDVLAGGAK